MYVNAYSPYTYIDRYRIDMHICYTDFLVYIINTKENFYTMSVGGYINIQFMFIWWSLNLF